MEFTERALKDFINHPNTDKTFINELLEKTDFAVRDGLFNHHVSFIRVDGYYAYYFEFLGHVWNKRKIYNGWIKYQNALMLNIKTGELKARHEFY